jgi:Zn-dependent protease
MTAATPGVAPSDGRAISPIALVLLAVWLAAGAALGLIDHPPGVLTFVFVLTGWVLAVVAHEFGHAWVALKAGDHTVEGKGYLTLDPLKYTNVLMSIVVPLAILAIGGIGFPGGAVYLRQDLMRSPAWRAAASLAGPAGTLIVLLLLSALLALVRSVDPGGAAEHAIAFLAFLQATALILNLLPIPGFDGYGAIRPFLPNSLRATLAPAEGLAALAFIALLMWSSQVSGLLFGAAFALCRPLGISTDALIAGLHAFQFWK